MRIIYDVKAVYIIMHHQAVKALFMMYDKKQVMQICHVIRHAFSFLGQITRQAHAARAACQPRTTTKRKQKCKKTDKIQQTPSTEYNQLMNPSYDVKLTTTSSPFLVH